MREEHLADRQLVVAEERLIHRHEAGLADRGAGLPLGERGGARLVAEHAHARADRAGGDEHDLLARGPERGDLRDKLGELHLVRALPAVREDAGAQLDHEAADVAEDLGTHAALVAEATQGRRAHHASPSAEEGDGALLDLL